MARPDQEIARLLDRFVCVRVTNMLGVDLSRYRFDYDLTFAALAMHPDGTVFHRYGGRPAGDAEGWLSVPSLVQFLEAGVAAHAGHAKDLGPKAQHEPQRIEDIPPFAAKVATGRVQCAHCHNVHDARTAHAIAEGEFEVDDKWIWPDPRRVGLTLDRDEQTRVVLVDEGSAAYAAGLRAGDVLRQAGDQRLASITDLQWVLERASTDGAEIRFQYVREGGISDATLALAKGWKRTTPREYAWRAFKWGLSPAPGFGGKPISLDEKRAHGIDEDVFAFRVTYFVTWGDHGHRGRVVGRAGLRAGDIVTAIDGKSDFADIEHFHAWVRLEKRVGEKLAVTFVRGDAAPRTIEFALPN